MGNMMAYRITLFLIFINFGNITINGMAPYMFLNSGEQLPTINSDPSAYFLSIFPSQISLSDVAVALFAFSLLIFFRSFVWLFFGSSLFYSSLLLTSLNLMWFFAEPVRVGIAIMYYLGYTQFMARQSFQGS